MLYFNSKSHSYRYITTEVYYEYTSYYQVIFFSTLSTIDNVKYEMWTNT